MRLTTLVAAAGALGAPAARHLPPDDRAAVAADVDVTAVVHDTRDVKPGALFCCVRGAHVDGHHLAPEAVAAGAAALLVDRPVDLGGPARSDLRPVPQVRVDDVRRAMGPVAAAFWGQPSRQLSVLGVTGTAGKTTATQLLRSVLAAAGRPCGVIGTLSGARTTPDGPELQALLADERDRGRSAVAMEVSSHGLELHRVDGTWFEAALFTNLSRDHLDFHATMDDYFAAKARLFTPAFTRHAVICTDDSWGRRLVDRVSGSGVEVHRYSSADARDLDLTPGGARFTWRGVPVRISLAGRFNVTNAVGVATVATALGIAPEAIAAGLEGATPVSGRFEPVEAGQPFTVLVDYAHKPDALEQTLAAGRELTRGELTVVFGCGGERDPGKRPLMGAVAGRMADRVVVTSDNPRSEDPLAIIDEVRAGLTGAAASVHVEPDRRRAIAGALDRARPGDVVLVAGKGHETTQTVGDRVLAFDDRAVAAELLSDAGWAGTGASGS